MTGQRTAARAGRQRTISDWLNANGCHHTEAEIAKTLDLGENRLSANTAPPYLLEAKLGELIKQEQEAGRLADKGQPKKCSIGGTLLLKDIGLTRKDSSRAQQIAEHQDLIPVMVEKSLAKMSTDLPTRTKMERIIYLVVCQATQGIVPKAPDNGQNALSISML